jgi:DNA (cytosine-5)-methyltransferase 1
MLKIGSLCTGYGGLDMATEAYFNAETVWTCEFDKHASKVIAERIGKPNYGNLKTTDWSQVEPIDILTAGYPCQPFSHAGLRKGTEDERHLWPYIKEIIRQLRPSYVILENVRGHFGLGFREVLSDITSIGYDARWTLIRASDVGAPHRRERLFIVAYPNSARWTRANTSNLQKKQSRDSWGFDLSPVANSQNSSDGCLSSRVHESDPKSRSSVNALGYIYSQNVPPALEHDRLNVQFVEYMMGLPKGWVTDLDLPRSQKLKILGNGVVPQQAYKALQILLDNNAE